MKPRRRWETVFSGDAGEALVVQASLEASGYRTFVPDLNTKLMYPPYSGAQPFDYAVQVPDDVAGEVAEIVGLWHEGVEKRRTETDRVARIGYRIRWLALFCGPFAFLLVPRYFRAVRKLPSRPPQHVMTIAACFVAILNHAPLILTLVLA